MGFVEPNTVLKADDGYIMYYTGGIDFFSANGFMMGMATSPDGLVWTKYDDPATTAAPFADSDPVLMPGPAEAWDSNMAWEGQVRRTRCGWEMYYSGATSLFEASIGYATSADGIQWTKSDANPIYEATDDPVTVGTGDVVEVQSQHKLFATAWGHSSYDVIGL